MEALDLGQLYQPLIATMTTLRRNLTTDWASWPLSWLVSTSRENTDTSIELPCQTDLVEFWDVCTNCRQILNDFLPDTGISSQVTANTSTLSTFVNTQTAVVDVDGSRKAVGISGNSSVPVADEDLFQLTDLTPVTGEQSCVTYLTTGGSSKKLVAFQKMKDYIIDLNIYRLVLINRILYFCEMTVKVLRSIYNYSVSKTNCVTVRSLYRIV